MAKKPTEKSAKNTGDNSGNQNYLVLARKYRPQKFDQLIGQEALVRTLSNAIKANRLHHAYVLHGIRGTGKTTTARILAKVLNCENGPSVTWADDDSQCQAIANGRHVDVLEFDAASHTGVDDIRELFEGVCYAPAQGKYKVYIIDEVHMLSKQAFNALLKTLEEPPEHVKFIFATTEVNKIPVTVLSRCQRFDLKRVTANTLTKYFMEILGKEEIKADENAVHMIARAADGSVRDGLSLLDQAIVLAGGDKVNVQTVGEMLGMADRTQLFDLFEVIMTGKPKESLAILAKMYENGQDPLMIISDLLQLTHLITKLKVVAGLDKSPDLTELEKTLGMKFAAKLNLENLARVYQMLLTATNEAKQADRPFEAVEMAIIRIIHLAPIAAIATLAQQEAPSLGKPSAQKAEASPATSPTTTASPATVATVKTEAEVVQKEAKLEAKTSVIQEAVLLEAEPASTNNSIQLKAKSVASNEACILNNQSDDRAVYTVKNRQKQSSTFTSWKQLVKAIKVQHSTLGSMLEQQVRPVSMADGELAINILNGLHSSDEIINNLNKFLRNETSQTWKIMQDNSGNSETLAETFKREGQERVAKAKQNLEIKQILKTFPDAEVVRVDLKEN